MLQDSDKRGQQQQQYELQHSSAAENNSKIYAKSFKVTSENMINSHSVADSSA